MHAGAHTALRGMERHARLPDTHVYSHTWQVCPVLNGGSAHLCCHLFCQNLSVNHCGFIHLKYPYLCRMPAIFFSPEADTSKILICRVASVRVSIT